jgi:hypothetical protein
LLADDSTFDSTTLEDLLDADTFPGTNALRERYLPSA